MLRSFESLALPADLDYRFTLVGDLVAELVIAPR